MSLTTTSSGTVRTGNMNKFAHGVRGYLTVGSRVIGVAQDISFDDKGDDDLAYIMGSRNPQAIEVINKAVRGTVKMLTINVDSNLVEVTKFVDTITSAGVATYVVPISEMGSVSGSMASMLGLIQETELVIYNKVAIHSDGHDMYHKVTIHGCVFKGKSYDYAKDSYWIQDADFTGTHITEEYETATSSVSGT